MGDGLYRIENVPFFAKRVSLGDLVCRARRRAPDVQERSRARRPFDASGRCRRSRGCGGSHPSGHFKLTAQVYRELGLSSFRGGRSYPARRRNGTGGSSGYQARRPSGSPVQARGTRGTDGGQPPSSAYLGRHSARSVIGRHTRLFERRRHLRRLGGRRGRCSRIERSSSVRLRGLSLVDLQGRAAAPWARFCDNRLDPIDSRCFHRVGSDRPKLAALQNPSAPTPRR